MGTTYTPQEAADYRRLSAVLSRIRYRNGWTFSLTRVHLEDGRQEDRIELRAVLTDADDPTRHAMICFPRPVSLAVTEGELVKACWLLTVQAVTHEAGHWFCVGDETPYNTHLAAAPGGRGAGE